MILAVAIPALCVLLLALLVRDTVLRLAAIAERGRVFRTHAELEAHIARVEVAQAEQGKRVEQIAMQMVMGGGRR